MTCDSITKKPYSSALALPIPNLNQTNINKLSKSIEAAKNMASLISEQKFQATNNSIFNPLKEIKPMSKEQLIEKIQAAKEQRELDEELYGPNLPEDSNSKLLNITKEVEENIKEVVKSVSNIRLFVLIERAN